MALSKIELKLGKKKISLTPKQFEELKQDMRDLDKDHHYYWYNYRWPTTWYNTYPYGQVICNGSTSTGTISNVTTTSTNATSAYSGATPTSAAYLSLDGTASSLTEPSADLNQGLSDPPAFRGSLLSVS